MKILFVAVAVLIAAGNTKQLPGILRSAREKGATQTAVVEVIAHLAFYVG